MSGRMIWTAQRIGGGMTGLFVFYLLFWWLGLEGPVSREALQILFESLVFRLSASVAIVALLVHACIGLWAIGSDYLSSTMVRTNVPRSIYSGIIGLVAGMYGLCAVVLIWAQ